MWANFVLWSMLKNALTVSFLRDEKFWLQKQVPQVLLHWNRVSEIPNLIQIFRVSFSPFKMIYFELCLHVVKEHPKIHIISIFTENLFKGFRFIRVQILSESFEWP